MKLIIIFAMFTLAAGEPDVSCCKPGDGVTSEDNNECIDEERNTTYSTRLLCSKVGKISTSMIDFKVADDGRMIMYFDGMEPQVENDKYCLANDTESSNETYIVLCDDTLEKILDESVLGYCMVVSSIFLCLTAAVYLVLPEMRDTQGKSIINFCVSLALGLGILAIMKLAEYSHMGLCATRGFLVYLFLLSSFFWTNAISIQILLNIRRPSIANYGWKPFIWYAIYAWGIPIVLTIAMAIVNFHPGTHPKPGIGLNTCWFYTSKQQWQYMYSVMMILILANIIIFMYITIHLCCQSFSSSHVKALRYKFVMTVRLFIVMGLPWIFEMIGSISPPHVIWGIIDIFNALEGPLIFLLLVVFRRKVIKGMYKRGWLDFMSGVVERHLAVGDDEEEVVQHTTTDVILDDRRVN